MMRKVHEAGVATQRGYEEKNKAKSPAGQVNLDCLRIQEEGKLC